MRTPPLAAALLAALAVASEAGAQPRSDFAFLGLTTEPIESGDATSGLRITYIFPSSAAESMGLRKDDQIVALNDIVIEGLEQFVAELRREKIDATVRFLVRRKGEEDLLELKGKIGSYNETMAVLQKELRERLIGKPPPELPRIDGWDPEKGTFTGDFDLESYCKGKVTILFGFDDFTFTNDQLRKGYEMRNFRRFQLMAQAILAAEKDAPVAWVGFYRDDLAAQSGEETMLEEGAKFLTENPPPFPVGAVRFPKKLDDERREDLFFLRNQGVLVLDPDGEVRYVQVLGPPKEEFFRAFQSLLQATATPAGEDPAGSEGAPDEDTPGARDEDAPSDASETGGAPFR